MTLKAAIRHHHLVTREQLRTVAGKTGILPCAYSIDGDDRDDTYVLKIEAGGWVVFFAERGKRNDLEWFETEHEACTELLLRLTADPTTRTR